MDYDECVRMNLYGGKQKNKRKRGGNGRTGRVFECMFTTKKNRKLTKMVVMLFQDDVNQEGGGVMGTLYEINAKRKGKTTKQTKAPSEKRENEQVQVDVKRCF